MRRMMALGVMIVSLVTAAPQSFADQGEQPRKATHMKVSGVVSKVQPGHTTVKTPWGSMTFSTSTGPNNLEVGEEVEMQVNESNAVIDVHRKGDPAHSHRFITGKLVHVGKMKPEIKVQTDDGEKVFPLLLQETKTKPLPDGTMITVELNEAGDVIDLHRMTVEMTFDEHPRTKPGYTIQVDGTVTKFQSDLVYVKTPAGQYTLLKKYAPSDASVGDRVSLWINEEGMVIDAHGKDKAKAGAHRLIFGKLVYVGKTKNQIKLQTPEGEKVFPLERMEVKAKPIPEGSHIVVELNERGAVIDLKKAQ